MSKRNLYLFLDRSTCSVTPFFSFFLALNSKVQNLSVVNFTITTIFCLFVSNTVHLSMLESGISALDSFSNSLALSRTFYKVSYFSHGMLVIFILYCSLHSTKCLRLLQVFLGVLCCSLSVLTCF